MERTLLRAEFPRRRPFRQENNVYHVSFWTAYTPAFMIDETLLIGNIYHASA